MTQNPRAVIGGNSPPDPIDEALAPYADTISEAANWLDGSPVETEAQMDAVDELIASMRKCGTAIDEARKKVTAPLRQAWIDEVDRWKPTEEDVRRIKNGLVAVVDQFKRKLAAEKAEAERKAREEAERKAREAHEAAMKANAADLESQRAAAQAKEEAEQAFKYAKRAGKDTVKGMRTVTKYEITDHRDALHWIARHDRDAVTAFVEEYVRTHHNGAQITGAHVWTEREAF